jgi:hypothetical protein
MSKTLMFIVYRIVEHTVISYINWRSAKQLGEHVQSHEIRKSASKLSLRIINVIVLSTIYGLDIDINKN